jgi:hypothetical protein
MIYPKHLLNIISVHMTFPKCSLFPESFPGTSQSFTRDANAMKWAHVPFHCGQQWFFYWQNFAKFQADVNDFYLYKGFFMEKKKTQIHQISKAKKFQITTDFNDKFQ